MPDCRERIPERGGLSRSSLFDQELLIGGKCVRRIHQRWAAAHVQNRRRSIRISSAAFKRRDRFERWAGAAQARRLNLQQRALSEISPMSLLGL